MRRLISKNAQFRVEIAPLEICSDLERLYILTSERFKGFVFPNIQTFLFDFADKGIFRSYHVKVYHGDRLIAASVFDKGDNSVMSILGMHDPQYSKYSLGVYTMLCEVDYAKEQGLRWFYPGYVLEESSLFDYKLSIGNFQFLQPTGRWKYDKQELVRQSPVPAINTKTDELEIALDKAKIPNKRLMYKLFSLGFAYPKGTFVREPIIFVLPELTNNPFKLSLAAYDEEMGRFVLRHPMMIQESFLSVSQTEEYQNPDIYYDQILQEGDEDCEYFDSPIGLCKRILELIFQHDENFGISKLHLLK